MEKSHSKTHIAVTYTTGKLVHAFELEASYPH